MSAALLDDGRRLRDTQRSKLYAAERAAFAKTHWDATWETLEETRDWMDQVTHSRAFQSRWGAREVPVVSGSGNNANWRGRVMLTTSGRRPWIVLHELAHWLESDRRREAGHGPIFCATYLTLVEIVLGAEAAKLLRVSFVAHRVKYRPGMAWVPKPGSRSVVTKQERVAKARQRDEADQQRLLAIPNRERAAQTIRAAVKAGEFGATGSRTRARALEMARKLEAVGT